MKKIIFFLLSGIYLQVNAATHVVTVSNFQFSPANLNVVVGDVIRWEWASGFHTTTSLTIPAAAASWNSPFLTSSGDFFEYTVTIQGVYDYYCDVHGVAMSGSFTASPVVPVTLSAFNLSIRRNQPILSWITQTESNADYFSVRRSYDGKKFSEIARVPATGNSSIEQNYSYTDPGIKSDVKFVYYELASTDKDGSFQLSPIRLLKYNQNIQRTIISISPNPVPASGHLMISFNAEVSGTLFARFVDMTGKLVLVSELSATEGVNNGHIHLADLPAGNYAVQFMLNGLAETYKIRKR